MSARHEEAAHGGRTSVICQVPTLVCLKCLCCVSALLIEPSRAYIY